MPLWKKAMVYLGLADDEDYGEYAEYEDPEQPLYGQSRPGNGPPAAPVSPYGPDSSGGVRTLPRDEPFMATLPPDPAPPSSAVKTLPPQSPQRLHILTPTDYSEGAKEIGDRLKDKTLVIMNLSRVDRNMAKRLLDFAAGLTYGLSGRIQKVGDGVFLLTPTGMEIAADEKRRLRETGLLFEDLDR